MVLLLEDLMPMTLSDIGKISRYDCRGLGYMSSQVTKTSYGGQIGGQIMFIYDH
jgi:hypothetical protein